MQGAVQCSRRKKIKNKIIFLNHRISIILWVFKGKIIAKKMRNRAVFSDTAIELGGNEILKKKKKCSFRKKVSKKKE